MKPEHKIDGLLKTEFKHRKLTARESYMRKRYTRTLLCPSNYQVILQIDQQGFNINDPRDTKAEAEWTRDMLAIALARIK